MNLNRNSYIFIQEKAFGNVIWKMAAILSRPQCGNNPNRGISVSAALWYEYFNYWFHIVSPIMDSYIYTVITNLCSLWHHIYHGWSSRSGTQIRSLSWLWDGMVWKPFVRGIHRLSVDSLHKRASDTEFWRFLCCYPEKAVEQKVELWFEKPKRACDVIVISDTILSFVRFPA